MVPTRNRFIAPGQWTSAHAAGFTTRHDLRDLLVIEHPWAPAQEGGYGQWEAVVRPPAGWRPGRPLYLSFYHSDNYSGALGDTAWVGAQVFHGHRFKQLLANGQLLWEEDVADEEFRGTLEGWFHVPPGKPGFCEAYRVVEITPHAAGKITLTFRVADKVASTVALPGDAYRRFVWSPHNPHEAALNFQTTAYFGDVALTSQPQPVQRKPTSIAARPARAKTRAIPATGIPLALIVPDKLPSPGYPVRTGVPLPRGAVPAGTSLGLRDARGKRVPLVAGETSHWPDGSVRWVLCEFVARRAGNYRLVPGAKPLAPERPVRVRGRTLSNGLLTLKLGQAAGPGAFDGIALAGGPALGRLDFSIKLNRVGWRDHFTARRRAQVVERVTPLCATVRLDGDMLDAGGRRFGPWRCRLHLWAGLPYLLAEWTLTNESDQAMAMLLDWSARLPLPDLDDAVVDFGPFKPGYDPEDIAVKAMGHYGKVDAPRTLPLYRDAELSCRQERADQARIYRRTTWVATADRAAVFVNLNHPRGGLTAAMRWFAEEFPKGIVVRPNLLVLATLPENEDALAWPHDRPFARIGRGEAKRQGFALWLHEGTLPGAQAQRFNACVQDAPGLFDSAWFIDCDVLEAGPPRKALPAWDAALAPVIERTGIGAPRLGHREYWDTCWSNDYRGRAHLGLIQYLETGDGRWRRYFDAACTHNRDVDIIHFCPEHPEWVGRCHAYGEDHTSCEPMGNIGMNCDGLLDHYLLTGDPDSLSAARGLAEHMLDCGFGRCAREVGWPLSQLVRWYEQTGDARFLRKAKECVAAAGSYVEPRRGVFSEIHGSWNYRGVVSFMTGYLAFGLIRYHRMTGDAEVLSLLGRLAEGVFAEIHPAPRRFRYSPFPENNPAPAARFHNALIGGLTGYLYLATGQRRYAQWARECYDGLVERCDEPQTSMDMLHTAGWMLRAVAKMKK